MDQQLFFPSLYSSFMQDHPGVSLSTAAAYGRKSRKGLPENQHSK
jgi:hypothetical protein